MTTILKAAVVILALILIASLLLAARSHKQRVKTERLSASDKSIIGDGAVVDWTPRPPRTARIRDMETRRGF
jgi:hypothetical protein